MNAEWRQRQDMIRALDRIGKVLEGIETCFKALNQKVEVIVDLAKE